MRQNLLGHPVHQDHLLKQESFLLNAANKASPRFPEGIEDRQFLPMKAGPRPDNFWPA
jgi:hypothetical protein